ncbi:MAG: hypothetical protein ACWA5U_02255 [bacterium]
MPFFGVLPHRRPIFQPEPLSDIGVNDAHAWRLNPAYRHVYNKLWLAQAQGLRAAPLGINPQLFGFAEQDEVFVKPITNLAGMSLNAGVHRVADLSYRAGSFWCERLIGQQTSTDCLVLNGQTQWFAHTLAAAEKNQQRPIYWQIGVDLPQIEPLLSAFIAEHLSHYTGICNVEMIGDKLIEMHLRGSNGFYDFYGDDFISAWVHLVDQHDWQNLAKVQSGYVYSMFAQHPQQQLHPDAINIAAQFAVRLQPDHSVPDRLAIAYAQDLSAIRACLTKIL